MWHIFSFVPQRSADNKLYYTIFLEMFIFHIDWIVNIKNSDDLPNLYLRGDFF